jgi:hypothetical protein
MKVLTVVHFSWGGQFPYQSTGVIYNPFSNESYYFYFRARNGYISLELYTNYKDCDTLCNPLKTIQICRDSFIKNKGEATKLIKMLFKLKEHV